MTEQIIVERFYAEFAICEQDGETVEISLDHLPDSVRVGDVYVKSATGWVIDREETDRRRAQATEGYNRLFRE